MALKIPTDASQFCLSKAKSDTGLSVLAQLQFIWRNEVGFISTFMSINGTGVYPSRGLKGRLNHVQNNHSEIVGNEQFDYG